MLVALSLLPSNSWRYSAKSRGVVGRCTQLCLLICVAWGFFYCSELLLYIAVFSSQYRAARDGMRCANCAMFNRRSSRKMNNKLSYRNRSRVIWYVEGIYSNPVTLKSGLEVTQGHWKWHHSIDRIRVPISVPYLWRDVVSFARYSELLVKNHEIFIHNLYLTLVKGWPRRNFAKVFHTHKTRTIGLLWKTHSAWSESVWRYALSDENDVFRPDGVARASRQRLRSRQVWGEETMTIC